VNEKDLKCQHKAEYEYDSLGYLVTLLRLVRITKKQ
jgi:hypothetical protein